jgi:hypothetical protein
MSVFQNSVWASEGVLEYIKQESFYRYVHQHLQIRLDAVRSLLRAYLHKLKDDPATVKQELVTKLIYSHPSSPNPVIGTHNTLYTIYQQIIGCDIPGYYKAVVRQIQERELFVRNIYSGTILDISEESLTFLRDFMALSVVDCIRYVITNDYYFLRMIAINPCMACYRYNADNQLAILKDLIHIVATSLNGAVHDKAIINLFGAPQALAIDNFDIHVMNMNKGVCEDDCIEIQYKWFDTSVPNLFSQVVWCMLNGSPSDDDRLQCQVTDKCLLANWSSTFLLTDDPDLASQIRASPNTRVLLICRTLQECLTSVKLNVPMQPFKHYTIPFADVNYKSEDQDIYTNVLFKSNSYTNYLITHHFKHVCPFTSKHMKLPMSAIQQSQVLVFNEGIVRYCARNNVPTLTHLDKTSPTKVVTQRCVVLFDNRENIMDVVSASITFYNLDPSMQWDFLFVGSAASCKFMKDMCGDQLKTLVNKHMSKKRFNIEVYNDMLKDPDTWSDILGLGYKQCLVVQDDGMVFRKGIEQFTQKYDFVGSPWVPCPDNTISLKMPTIANPEYVGNGGLSYRNPEVMLEICSTHKNDKALLFNNSLQPLPEDVFFGRFAFKMDKRIPKFEDAMVFGMEQTYNKDSKGIHKFWVYHPLNLVLEYMYRLPNCS